MRALRGKHCGLMHSRVQDNKYNTHHHSPWTAPPRLKNSSVLPSLWGGPRPLQFPQIPGSGWEDSALLHAESKDAAGH